MKMQKRVKVEVLALLCVALVWAVNLKTDCVPRAEAAALEQAVKIAPNWENGWYTLGWVYESYRNREKADEAYDRWYDIALKKAVESDPADKEARFELVRHYYEANDYPGAIENLREALRIDPTWEDAYNWLAGCYWESGQYRESIETWKQAKVNLPEWRWPYMCLAFDYSDLGMYDEAVSEWKYLIAREPDMAGLHVLLGNSYRAAGKCQEAKAAYEQALAIDPNHQQAKHGAETCLGNGRTE
jgi:tetratricopeptide (TPR) repeat protein